MIKVSDIRKINWIDGNIWDEKWYNTQGCFIVFYDSPLTKLFTNFPLDCLALNTHWYYNQVQSDRWSDEFKVALYQGGFSSVERVVDKTNKYTKEINKIINQVEKAQDINLTLYKQVKRGFLLLWEIFLIDLHRYIDGLVEDLLSSKKFSQSELDEIKTYFSTPEGKFAFQVEQAAFEKIAELYKKKYGNKVVNFNDLNHLIKESLDKHCQKFRWLTCNNFYEDPFKVKDYYKKLTQLLEIKKLPKSSKLSLRKAIKQKLTKKDINNLNLIKKHVYFDNLAADLYAQLDFLFQSLIYKKFGISFKDQSVYSFEDLEILISINKKLSQTEISQRIKFRVMIQINGEIKTFYHKGEYNQIEQIIKGNIKDLSKNIKSFTGIIASKGRVEGVVRMVNRVEDMDKIKEGDILVSVSTRPDIIIAMRKAGAIVTDWGGVTSHAAIVSRELGIPCITGTQIATKVLKDGDRIEVDANRGIVKILN